MQEELRLLKKLVKNKAEMLKAEERILQAICMDCEEGIETDGFVIEKVFEISNIILALNESIKKCQEKIRKK